MGEYSASDMLFVTALQLIILVGPAIAMGVHWWRLEKAADARERELEEPADAELPWVA